MSDWLENLKCYALSDDMDYRLTWEDAGIALEEIERLKKRNALLEDVAVAADDLVECDDWGHTGPSCWSGVRKALRKLREANND